VQLLRGGLRGRGPLQAGEREAVVAAARACAALQALLPSWRSAGLATPWHAADGSQRLLDLLERCAGAMVAGPPVADGPEPADVAGLAAGLRLAAALCAADLRDVCGLRRAALRALSRWGAHAHARTCTRTRTRHTLSRWGAHGAADPHMHIKGAACKHRLRHHGRTALTPAGGFPSCWRRWAGGRLSSRTRARRGHVAAAPLPARRRCCSPRGRPR
jgi:hypothetical protein